MTGVLHELACEGPSTCTCRVLYPVVRARDSSKGPVGYNQSAEVESESVRIPNGVPVVLNPLPGRRSASSRLRR